MDIPSQGVESWKLWRLFSTNVVLVSPSSVGRNMIFGSHSLQLFLNVSGRSCNSSYVTLAEYRKEPRDRRSNAEAAAQKKCFHVDGSRPMILSTWQFMMLHIHWHHPQWHLAQGTGSDNPSKDCERAVVDVVDQLVAMGSCICTGCDRADTGETFVTRKNWVGGLQWHAIAMLPEG